MRFINLFDDKLWEKLALEGRGIIAIRLKDEEYLEVFIDFLIHHNYEDKIIKTITFFTFHPYNSHFLGSMGTYQSHILR